MAERRGAKLGSDGVQAVLDFRLVASADSDAVGLVLERYREVVFRLAYHIVLDAESAHDVAQDVMLRAVRSFDKLSAHPDPDHWIRCVTVRAARSFLRKARRVRRWSADANPETLTPQLSDPVTDMALREVLGGLPVDLRTVLALAVGEQLSYVEIASITGTPVGTVASRLNAAKAAFRERWEARES
jgi:RNA polymerase sigma-70 factor (ECF subfamily)